MTYYAVVRNDEYLEHHGIKGQKWGIRRFQNLDGSWTAAGKARRGQYKTDEASSSSKKTRASKRSEDDERKAMMKKVAIGVGVTAAIVGTVYASKRLSEIKELKADLDFASGRVFETPSKKLMSKNWDHYSLGTKLKLARQAKEDKNSRWRTIDHISSEMYNTKNHKTISSHIEDMARRHRDSVLARQESEQIFRNAKENAKQAYLNKSENSRNIIDTYYRMADGRPMSASSKARVALDKTGRSLSRAAASTRKAVADKTIRNEKLGKYATSVAKDAGDRTIKTVAAATALYGAKQFIKKRAEKKGKDGDKVLRDIFPKKK